MVLAAVLTERQMGMHPRPGAKLEAATHLFGGPIAAALGIINIASHGMQMAGAVGTGMEEVKNLVEDANKTALYPGLRNVTHQLAALSGQKLEGNNDLHDANLCPDNEEMFGNLCYQRCHDLTQGQHPIRSTAFSCCKQEPCNAFNSVFSSIFKPCHGLDVGGRTPGVGCPHSPGDCLVNEEFHLGQCYKKCVLLTDSEYPYRSAADTCCRSYMLVECIDAANLWTNATFSVGGGLGDELFEAEAGQVHPPLPALAEAQTTTTLPVAVLT